MKMTLATQSLFQLSLVGAFTAVAAAQPSTARKSGRKGHRRLPLPCRRLQRNVLRHRSPFPIFTRDLTRLG